VRGLRRIAVLAMLALHPGGKIVSTDRLADAAQATAGVVNAPLASFAVHSGSQFAAPQPFAGRASRKPASVPT
jgi:hypothetical protein